MEILSKLCGSEAKVKIMRLFLFNPDQVFSSAEISNRAKVSAPSVRHEIDILKKIGLIKGKQFFSTPAVTVVKKGKKISPKKKKEGGWQLDPSFPYMSALKALLIDTVLVKYADIVKRLGSAGKIKLVVISGVFMHMDETRVDLFVVGDFMRFPVLENVIRGIESEIGKELRYAAFETEDFKYRLSLRDKLVRDVFDYPHKIIFDRLNLQYKA